MKVKSYPELSPRAKTAAVINYLQDAWELKGRPTKKYPRILFEGWLFNRHGERIS